MWREIVEIYYDITRLIGRNRKRNSEMECGLNDYIGRREGRKFLDELCNKMSSDSVNI